MCAGLPQLFEPCTAMARRPCVHGVGHPIRFVKLAVLYRLLLGQKSPLHEFVTRGMDSSHAGFAHTMCASCAASAQAGMGL